MTTQPDPHGDGTMGSKPTQGIFIGYLALGLFIFAVLFAAFGILAGATHGFK